MFAQTWLLPFRLFSFIIKKKKNSQRSKNSIKAFFRFMLVLTTVSQSFTDILVWLPSLLTARLTILSENRQSKRDTPRSRPIHLRVWLMIDLANVWSEIFTRFSNLIGGFYFFVRFIHEASCWSELNWAQSIASREWNRPVKSLLTQLLISTFTTSASR